MSPFTLVYLALHLSIVCVAIYRTWPWRIAILETFLGSYERGTFFARLLSLLPFVVVIFSLAGVAAWAYFLEWANNSTGPSHDLTNVVVRGVTMLMLGRQTHLLFSSRTKLK